MISFLAQTIKNGETGGEYLFHVEQLVGVGYDETKNKYTLDVISKKGIEISRESYNKIIYKLETFKWYKYDAAVNGLEVIIGCDKVDGRFVGRGVTGWYPLAVEAILDYKNTLNKSDVKLAELTKVALYEYI